MRRARSRREAAGETSETTEAAEPGVGGWEEEEEEEDEEEEEPGPVRGSRNAAQSSEKAGALMASPLAFW